MCADRLKFISTDPSFEELVIDSTWRFVWPMVSVANVPQLTVDSLVKDTGANLVGYLLSRDVFPFAGVKKPKTSKKEKKTEQTSQLSYGLEVYVASKLKLLVLQQRTPCLPNRRRSFVRSILSWVALCAREHSKARVYSLPILAITSEHLHVRGDEQLSGVVEFYSISQATEVTKEARKLGIPSLHVPKPRTTQGVPTMFAPEWDTVQGDRQVVSSSADPLSSSADPLSSSADPLSSSGSVRSDQQGSPAPGNDSSGEQKSTGGGGGSSGLLLPTHVSGGGATRALASVLYEDYYTTQGSEDDTTAMEDEPDRMLGTCGPPDDAMEDVESMRALSNNNPEANVSSMGGGVDSVDDGGEVDVGDGVVVVDESVEEANGLNSDQDTEVESMTMFSPCEVLLTYCAEGQNTGEGAAIARLVVRLLNGSDSGPSEEKSSS